MAYISHFHNLQLDPMYSQKLIRHFFFRFGKTITEGESYGFVLEKTSIKLMLPQAKTQNLQVTTEAIFESLPE